jgi:hypothetical protein
MLGLLLRRRTQPHRLSPAMARQQQGVCALQQPHQLAPKPYVLLEHPAQPAAAALQLLPVPSPR